MLQYSQYIDFAKEYRKLSPVTVLNYQNAVKTCQITGFDSDNTGALWTELLAKLNGGTSYGAIANLMSLTRNTLKINGSAGKLQKTYEYHLLLEKLGQMEGVPEAYSENQMKQILWMTQPNIDLWKVCMLCTYSGLRIRATQGVKFSDFKKMPNGVYCYIVESKGTKYIAAISGYAFEFLRKFGDTNDYLTSSYQDKYFDINMRERLYTILRKNAALDIIKNKSPFHSMRKFFAQKTAESGLLPADTALLMGHVPKTMAYKHYINSHAEGMFDKQAEIYAKTFLNTWRAF